MSYAIDIETMFDGRVSLNLPGLGRVAMSPTEAVAVGLALLKEAGDHERVADWLDWAIDYVIPNPNEEQAIRAQAKAGIMDGLPCPGGVTAGLSKTTIVELGDGTLNAEQFAEFRKLHLEAEAEGAFDDEAP